MLLAIADVLVWLGAAVLVAAGVLKLRSPLPAATFLHLLRVPASRLAVRAGAAIEIAAGAAVLAVGGPIALATAGVLYVSFVAALLGHRLRTGESSVSCGCFGSTAAVPVATHASALAVVLWATAVAGLAGRESLVAVVGSVAPLEAVLLVALLGLTLAAALGYSTTGSGAPAARPAFSLTIERRGDR